MPRSTFRKQVLSSLCALLEERQRQAHERFLLKNDTNELNQGRDEMDDDDDSTIEGFIDAAVVKVEKAVRHRRYFLPRQKYRRKKQAMFDIFKRDLCVENEEDGTPPWLSDIEFLEKYRIHRESFHALVDKIKDHDVFKLHSGKVKQEPVEYQLMVFLVYIGTSGSGASNPRLRNTFGIGRGTSELYKRRVVKAIRSLRAEVVFWPDDDERKAIANRIKKNLNGSIALLLLMARCFRLHMSHSQMMHLTIMAANLRILFRL
jgi:hypothetical protein